MPLKIHFLEQTLSAGFVVARREGTPYYHLFAMARPNRLDRPGAGMLCTGSLLDKRVVLHPDIRERLEAGLLQLEDLMPLAQALGPGRSRRFAIAALPNRIGPVAAQALCELLPMVGRQIGHFSNHEAIVQRRRLEAKYAPVFRKDRA